MMTAREEIREGLLAEIKYIMKVGSDKTKIAEAECYTDGILRFQSDRGVVIKVGREMPNDYIYRPPKQEEAYCAGRNTVINAGWVVVEPLIEETTGKG